MDGWTSVLAGGRSARAPSKLGAGHSQGSFSQTRGSPDGSGTARASVRLDRLSARPVPLPQPPSCPGPLLGQSMAARTERWLRKVFGGSHEVSALDSGSSPAPALPRRGARGRRFTSLHLAPHGSVKGREGACRARGEKPARSAPRPEVPSHLPPPSLCLSCLGR